MIWKKNRDSRAVLGCDDKAELVTLGFRLDNSEMNFQDYVKKNGMSEFEELAMLSNRKIALDNRAAKAIANKMVEDEKLGDISSDEWNRMVDFIVDSLNVAIVNKANQLKSDKKIVNDKERIKIIDLEDCRGIDVINEFLKSMDNVLGTDYIQLYEQVKQELPEQKISLAQALKMCVNDMDKKKTQKPRERDE